MKKNFLRILATISIVLAVVFAVVLLVAIFGGISAEQFDNSLVKGLFVALAAIFLACAVATLALAFANDENVKEIVLRSGKEGGTRTTVGVVKKIAKSTVRLAPGVKYSKCTVIANEYGVRLKVTIKVKDSDVGTATTHVRALLEDAFYGALSFRFHSIEIKVKKLKPSYVVPTEDVARAADAKTPEETPVLPAESALAETDEPGTVTPSETPEAPIEETDEPAEEASEETEETETAEATVEEETETPEGEPAGAIVEEESEKPDDEE